MNNDNIQELPKSKQATILESTNKSGDSIGLYTDEQGINGSIIIGSTEFKFNTSWGDIGNFVKSLFDKPKETDNGQKKETRD